MTSARALALICAADAMFGDPAWFPHPVKIIGALCTRVERIARAYGRGNAQKERQAGAMLWAALVGGTYVCSTVILACAHASDARFGALLEVGLGWTTIAARDLLSEVRAVIAALDAGDMPRARTRVARIVGRDTAQLDAGEIARATIETLAESACDGIAAPLLALALGGVPLALAFKAASTLDSMLGHIEAPYTHLGWAAARLDDFACFVPARITALAIVLCSPAIGGAPSRALAVLLADGHRHRSPNAGRPEAAMAGALGVRLGGTNYYDGIAHRAPTLGPGLPEPTVADIRRAAALIAASSFAMAVAIVGLRCLVIRAVRKPR